MRALRNPSFRRLWAGQTLSGVGDAMVIVVLGLFVTQQTGSATDVGLVLTAYTAPLVALLLLGGVLADRLPRRGLMIATDLVRAGLHGLLAVLIAVGAARVWHLVLIGIAFGAAEAFFRPAYTGLLPQTVSEDEIQDAQAVTGASRETAELAGPALGTVLVVGVGAAGAFAIDALTFVVSAALLVGLRPRERGRPAARTTLLAELREGWTAVRDRTWVWATILAFSAALLFGLAPLWTLGASISESGYGTIAIYGAVQTAFGAGTLAGSLLAVRWRPRYPMRTGTLLALGWPPGFAAFALGAPVVALVIITLVGGVGVGLFGVWWETALVERIPPHLLSRVSAYDWMGSLALLPAGFLLAGVLGAAVGESLTLGVGSALALVALALGVVPRQTRTLARIEPGQTAANLDGPALTAAGPHRSLVD